MKLQDVNKIPARARELKKRQKNMYTIMKLLHVEFNYIGKEIIEYEAKQALGISKTSTNKKEKEVKGAITWETNKKGRSRIQPIHKKKRSAMRPIWDGLQGRTPVRTPDKTRKAVSKVQREKLQYPVSISQLPPQQLSRDIYVMVDKKIRSGRIRKVSTGKQTNKKVVKGGIK